MEQYLFLNGNGMRYTTAGFCTAFMKLEAARQKKEGEQLLKIRKEIEEYSLEKQNELYKRELKILKKENEELKKENQKLAKALDKARLAYL